MTYDIHPETPETVEITCSLEEIAGLETHQYRLWATPTPDGLANQVYLASQPSWRDDFLLATAKDFLAVEGWNDIGWNDMTDEEQEEQGKDEITITVPRAPQSRD